jgi:hypothetical protein
MFSPQPPSRFVPVSRRKPPIFAVPRRNTPGDLWIAQVCSEGDTEKDRQIPSPDRQGLESIYFVFIDLQKHGENQPEPVAKLFRRNRQNPGWPGVSSVTISCGARSPQSAQYDPGWCHTMASCRIPRPDRTFLDLLGRPVQVCSTTYLRKATDLLLERNTSARTIRSSWARIISAVSSTLAPSSTSIMAIGF